MLFFNLKAGETLEEMKNRERQKGMWWEMRKVSREGWAEAAASDWGKGSKCLTEEIS